MFVPWGFVICLVCAGLAAALGGWLRSGSRELSWIKTLGLARKRNCQEIVALPQIAAAALAASGRCWLPLSNRVQFVALRSAEYETRAQECDDMANATRDLNQKQLWLAVARHWHELADKIRRAGF